MNALCTACATRGVAAMKAVAVALTLTTTVAAAPPRLPEFTQATSAAWVNSPPLHVAELHGSVVLLNVWTLECWNCHRSFAWLRALQQRYQAQGLRVIGIHSPEFEREHDVARVRASVREYDLEHPVMIDNDLAYWHALDNRYWPAFYLADRQGRLRHVFVGETHAGDAQARRIEQAVETLLAE